MSNIFAYVIYDNFLSDNDFNSFSMVANISNASLVEVTATYNLPSFILDEISFESYFSFFIFLSIRSIISLLFSEIYTSLFEKSKLKFSCFSFNIFNLELISFVLHPYIIIN